MRLPAPEMYKAAIIIESEQPVGLPIGSVTLVGLGVVGPEKTVNSLVGSLPMLR